MGVPRAPRLYNLKDLIKEETKLFINEVFDNLIPTEFKVIKKIKYDDTYYDQYLFSTNSGEKYEVDFFTTILDLSQLINVKEFFPNDEFIKCIDIGFTAFNNVRTDIHDLGIMNIDPNNYIKRTNNKEQYEVLGKVAYIINYYINSHTKQKIYAIGGSDQSNLRVYNNMFNKLFKSFTMIKDESDYYYNGANYYIKQI